MNDIDQDWKVWRAQLGNQYNVMQIKLIRMGFRVGYQAAIHCVNAQVAPKLAPTLRLVPDHDNNGDSKK